MPVSFGLATLLKLFNENTDKPESNLNMTASTDTKHVIFNRQTYHLIQRRALVR